MKPYMVITAKEIKKKVHFDVLVQDCSNSTNNVLELLQSCTKPSI